MDNLTHTLAGLTLARAGVGRRTPWAVPTLLVASNAPDADIITALTGGSLEYLAAHRGVTHGPLGVMGLGLLSAATVVLWYLTRRRALPGPAGVASPGTLRAPWALQLAGVGVLGVAVHVLMDLPTSYGTRLLSPFVSTWYAVDWMPIVDIYLWAILIGSLLVARRRPALRATAARVALVLMLLDYTGRAWLQSRALEAAAARDAVGREARCAEAPVLTRHPAVLEAALAGPGACIRAAAIPTFVSPFTWRTIRQYPDGYELSDRSLLRGAGSVARAWVPSAAGPAVARARATRTARVFLDFSRMPASAVTDLGAGHTLVRIVDVRFVGHPLALEADPKARAPFVVSIELDSAGRIMRERLGN